MNRKELIIQVFSQPLIQELLEKKLLTEKQLIDWILLEQDQEEGSPQQFDSNQSQVARTMTADAIQSSERNIQNYLDQEEEKKEKNKIDGTPHIHTLRLPVALALNAATTILKIVKQIDSELGIEMVDGFRKPTDETDEELVSIADANTNTERRMQRHVIVTNEGELSRGNLGEESLVAFHKAINIEGTDYLQIMKEPAEENLKRLDVAIGQLLKNKTPEETDLRIELSNGFTATVESLSEIIKFLSIVNGEKKSIVTRAREILQKKGGYKSSEGLKEILRSVLRNEGLDSPEQLDFEDVYSLFNLVLSKEESQ